MPKPAIEFFRISDGKKVAEIGERMFAKMSEKEMEHLAIIQRELGREVRVCHD